MDAKDKLILTHTKRIALSLGLNKTEKAKLLEEIKYLVYKLKLLDSHNV